MIEKLYVKKKKKKELLNDKNKTTHKQKNTHWKNIRE